MKNKQSRPILVVSNALINSKREILLGLRADCGRWEIPGGKVEAEAVIDGGRREQREESGMKLLGTPKLLGYADGWEWNGVVGKKWHVCLLFLWKEWEGEPKLVDGSHLEWKWFPLDNPPPLENMNYGTRNFFKNIFPGVEL